jgi:hypothetical protein
VHELQLDLELTIRSKWGSLILYDESEIVIPRLSNGLLYRGLVEERRPDEATVRESDGDDSAFERAKFRPEKTALVGLCRNSPGEI